MQERVPPSPVRFMNGAYVLLSDGWAVPGVTCRKRPLVKSLPLTQKCGAFDPCVHSLQVNGLNDSAKAQLRQAGGAQLELFL